MVLGERALVVNACEVNRKKDYGNQKCTATNLLANREMRPFLVRNVEPKSHGVK